MKRKHLILIGLALAIIAALWGYKEYNREVERMSSEKTEHSINADEMLQLYESNEEEANSKYLDKIVEVSGVVDKVEKDGDQTNIYLKTSNPVSSVICELEDGQANVNNIKTGDQITIKGVCTGYLMDVVMVRCILINK